MTWKRQIVKQVEEVGLKKEDAVDRAKWCDAVNKLSRIHEVNLAKSVN